MFTFEKELSNLTFVKRFLFNVNNVLNSGTNIIRQENDLVV
jgi:hypothetical protein